MRITWFGSAATWPLFSGNQERKREWQNFVFLMNQDDLMHELRSRSSQLLLLRLDLREFSELVQRVAAVRPDMPVILLTARSEEQWGQFIRNGGLDMLDFPRQGFITNGGNDEFENSVPGLQHLDVGLRRAVMYIHGHIFDTALSLAEVASQVPVSRFHFSRLFKKHMGISFREYMIHLRMEAAKRMLIQGERSVTEVCFAVGYNDLTHFGRIFRKQTGKTPSVFRNRISHNVVALSPVGVATGVQ